MTVVVFYGRKKARTPGGYSLCSDNRDDRHIFWGFLFTIWYFVGLFKQNPLKRQSWYLLGYKNSSFEYASLINSGLLVFFKVNF